jgi:hypothetical protein
MVVGVRYVAMMELYDYFTEFLGKCSSGGTIDLTA